MGDFQYWLRWGNPYSEVKSNIPEMDDKNETVEKQKL